jgi:hypothetical protein
MNQRKSRLWNSISLKTRILRNNGGMKDFFSVALEVTLTGILVHLWWRTRILG